MSKPTFQQKTKLMAKLFDSGCNTETKANKLFSYLGGGTDEQSGT